MNKRDREQLRASIAKDLVQGQGEHSPTKELLKQYAPLEGIITSPVPDVSPRPGHATPVENTMAPHATVAQRDQSAWHDATVAPHATVAGSATQERYAMVKGELRVPNTINFRLFPTLEPFAKAVYYQHFLLSHGFRRDTCVVGLAKLAKSVLMSQRKVQNTITYLETSRAGQADSNGPRRAFERGYLPGAAAGHRHGTGRHRGRERHRGTSCHRGTGCHQ